MYLKYKLHMTAKGMMAPPWIQDGGYFGNSTTHELIGFTPDEADREYYVPDTVTEYTKTELKTYVRTLGLQDEDGNALTDAECDTQVDNWCAQFEG